MNVAAIANAAAAVVNATMVSDLCDVQEVFSQTSDGAGGSAETWATVGSVRCQVSAITAGNATIAEKLSEVAEYEITFPAGTTVTAGHRIRHTRGAVTTVYRIVGVRRNETFDLARTVLARVVT